MNSLLGDTVLPKVKAINPLLGGRSERAICLTDLSGLTLRTGSLLPTNTRWKSEGLSTPVARKYVVAYVVIASYLSYS